MKRWTLCAVLLLLLFPATAAADRGLALVYCGPVAEPGAAKYLAIALEELEYRVKNFEHADELPGLLPGAALLAIGGTKDDLGPLRQEFTPDVVRALQDFVRGGGRYVGICGGAYLASERCVELLAAGKEYPGSLGAPEPVEDAPEWVRVTYPGFGLAPVRAALYGEGMKPCLVPIRWQGQLRSMYYQGGPWFEPLGAAGTGAGMGTTVLATYESGDWAAVVQRLGTGAALLIGPHPEADEDWLIEDGLPTQGWQDSWDLLLEAITAL